MYSAENANWTNAWKRIREKAVQHTDTENTAENFPAHADEDKARHIQNQALDTIPNPENADSSADLILEELDNVRFENIEQQSSTMRESLRALRTNIQFCGDDIKAVLFTSVQPNEGKSTVVQSLGRSFAELGKRVLILDTDMRKSVLLGRYRIRTESGEEMLGLSHYLSGQTPLSHIVYGTDVKGLWIVWAGQMIPNPTELLEKNYFREMVSLAKSKFDYILLDCAPMTAAIDAAVVSKVCDGAVIVIEQGKSSIRAVKDAKRQLEISGIHILGCVLNKVKMERNRYYGRYYGGYYGNYYGKYYGKYGEEPAKDKKVSKNEKKWKGIAGKLIGKLRLLTTAILLCSAMGLSSCGQMGEAPATVISAEHLEKNAQDEPVTVLRLNKKKYACRDNIKAYLIMGTDYSGNEDARGDDYQGSLADFLAVIVVNRTQETCGVVEINRNTITDVNIIDQNGDGEALAVEQICTAHWYGGNKRMSCRNTERAVSRLLGKLPISGYYSIGLAEIGRLNHAVGGVAVTIEDDFSKVDSSLVMGDTITLNDEQAVHFLQGRLDVGDGANESRMRRQEQYLKNLLDKTAGDQSYAEAVWNALDDSAVTDISDRDISVLMDAYSSYDNKGFLAPMGKTVLGDTLRDGELHEEFYADEDSLTGILVELCHLEALE